VELDPAWYPELIVCTQHLEGFNETYKQKGWTPPRVDYMDVSSSVPNCPSHQLWNESYEEYKRRWEENYGWLESEHDLVGEVVIHDPKEQDSDKENLELDEEDLGSDEFYY
jgi:hypothetical protein